MCSWCGARSSTLQRRRHTNTNTRTTTINHNTRFDAFHDAQNQQLLKQLKRGKAADTRGIKKFFKHSVRGAKQLFLPLCNKVINPDAELAEHDSSATQSRLEDTHTNDDEQVTRAECSNAIGTLRVVKEQQQGFQPSSKT